MTESKGSWGGSRPGAGNPEFKPKWKSGKTTVIRVPEAIADEVLVAARQIDEGEAVTLSSIKPETVDSATQHENVTQLKELYQKVGELETGLFKAHRELERVAQERDKYFEEISEIRLELENLKSDPVTQRVGDEADKEEIRRLNAELRLVKQQREDFRNRWEKAKEDNGNLFRELKSRTEDSVTQSRGVLGIDLEEFYDAVLLKHPPRDRKLLVKPMQRFKALIAEALTRRGVPVR